MSQQQKPLVLVLVLLALFVTGETFLPASVTSREEQPVNFCVCRGLRCQDHRGSGGPSLLHQVPGVPPVFAGSLLRGHAGPPSVGGFCRPLLDTVSTAASERTER